MQKNTDKYLLDELYKVLTTVENEIFETIGNGKTLGKHDEIDLLVPALASSLSLLRQIILLCGNGFPDGALMLARKIYEQMIICSFIEEQEDKSKHDDILEKYFQDAELIKLKYQNEQAKRFRIDEEILSTDELIKKHNEKYGSTLKQQYWWAGKSSFKSLSDEIIKRDNAHYGLFNNMHMEYKLACLVLHPSSFGNYMNIGSNVVGIDMRARDKGHENALFLAISSLIPIVGYTYDYLELASGDCLSELNRLGIYYLKMLRKQDVAE